MIDTTQLPPEIQASLADHQPIQWIPLPVGPGQADMTIPVKTAATPRLMDPWVLDQSLTTPATQVYRLAKEHLAVLTHADTISMVHASDEPTLSNTLNALNHDKARSHTTDRGSRPLEHGERRAR